MSESSSYKTIHKRNKYISFTTKNKQFGKNKKFLNFIYKSLNRDEDDIKHNNNFKKFMDNLLEKEENKEIIHIKSNKIFFQKESNLNHFLSTRNKKNKIIWPLNNDNEKKSIGLECNIFKSIKSRNYSFRKDNSIFNNNTTNNIKTFSLQEFDGKMLNKSRTKKDNYFKKIKKIPKMHNKVSSFNYIRKTIPKNLIPKIMFQSNKTIKNAILFLKDKINNNKNIEHKNSINSYSCSNEKKNLILNKKNNNDSINNIDNIFPLIKLKMINKDKDIIENIKKSRKKNSKTVGTIEINKKNDCLNHNNYFKEMIRNKFF